MLLSTMFNVTQGAQIDDGIQRYEYHGYEPDDGNKLNDTGEIKINIKNSDEILHPSQSYLLFEGRLTKANGAAYADADKVTLINNALMYLFSSSKYALSSRTIEEVSYTGQACTMFGLLVHSRGFSKAQGLNQLWCKDTHDSLTDANQGYLLRQEYIIRRPAAKGSFSFIMPLKDIFGFCDDYNKVVYGFKHTLTLVRRSDNDAIIRDDAAGAGKITLNRLIWMMPHVIPSETEKLPFYKVIESKSEIPVAFRSRRCETVEVVESKKFSWTLPSQSSPNFPRYIIVGFQTNRDNDQKKNPAIFDNVKINMIRAKINSNSYPEYDYALSFPNNQVARAYRDAASFSINYYGLNELITDSSISTTEYCGFYPLFVFDVSRHEEKIKLSTTDIKIEATFDENVPANTQAFALIISDRICTFKSNGKDLSLIN